MTVQVKRNAPRCHWLSAAVFLALFTAAKGVTSPQHSLGAAYGDDTAQRQLRGNGPASTERDGDNVEERGIESLNVALNLFDKMVTRDLVKPPIEQDLELWDWMVAVKKYGQTGMATLSMRFQPSTINQIREVMKLRYGEVEAQELWYRIWKGRGRVEYDQLHQLNKWKEDGMSDEDIMLRMLRNSMLTDRTKRNAWIIYTNEHLDGKVPYTTLFLDMQDKYAFKDVAEFAVAVKRATSNDLVFGAAKQLEASLYKRLVALNESPDVLYERFEFNKEPFAFSRPASLDFWAGYARMNKMENLEENLFAKLLLSYPYESDLAFDIMQSTIAKSTPLADGLLKLLVERWLTNGTFRKFHLTLSTPATRMILRWAQTHNPRSFYGVLLAARFVLPMPSFRELMRRSKLQSSGKQLI